MLTSVILIILICVCINYLISNYRKRLRFVQVANAIPGPKPLPIIGNSYYFIKKGFDALLESTHLLANIYSSPFRIWLGNILVVMIDDPDQAQTIFQNSSCLNKTKLYDPLKSWLGTGLVTAPDIWVKHRKMMVSSFNTNILRELCDLFVEQSSIFTKKLEHMVDTEVDLFDDISRCSLDSIHATSLGIKLASQTNKNNQYVKSLKRLSQIYMRRIQNIFLFPDIIFNLTFLKREYYQHLNCIYSLTEKVIQQKVNAKNNLDTTENKSTKSSKKVLLDLLIEASDEGKKFTHKDLLDAINTISFAVCIMGYTDPLRCTEKGTDTTAVSLNFTIFLLANFPEVQEKVYEELMGIYGAQDPESDPVKFEDLQYMNYLERVIKESLRLFPAIPYIGRYLTEDVKTGGYILPKGANILVAIIELHRKETIWPNALTFDPGRFLPERRNDIYPHSYIPFSSGSRNCIGLKYAMISMKIFLATLVRTYVLRTDKRIRIDEIKLKMDIMLVPYNPLKVKIKKRNL